MDKPWIYKKTVVFINTFKSSNLANGLRVTVHLFLKEFVNSVNFVFL